MKDIIPGGPHERVQADLLEFDNDLDIKKCWKII